MAQSELDAHVNCLFIDKTPERMYRCLLGSMFISTMCILLSLLQLPYCAVCVCVCLCAFRMHEHGVFLCNCVNLKVTAVDLAGVHPLTSPGRLHGLGSEWALTQGY